MYKFILRNNRPVRAVCEIVYEMDGEAVRVPFADAEKALIHADYLRSRGINASSVPLEYPPETLINALSLKTFTGGRELSDFIAAWEAGTLSPDPVELIHAILGA